MQEETVVTEKIEQEQVWSVLEFANNLYHGLNGYGYYTPQVQNQNQLNLNNTTTTVTYDGLLKALENSKDYQDQLKAYSQNLEWVDAIYGKTLRLYESMLSFDWYYECINIKDDAEWKSKEYKDDLKRLYKFFDNFDYKSEFRNILKQVIRQGVFYGWFRDSYGTIDDTPIDIEYKVKKQQKFSIQPMPQDYCLLSNKWEGGMIYDFNLAYFLQPMVDIKLYDPSFYGKFSDAFQGDIQPYIPSNQLNNRNGNYVYWTQCSPLDGMVCVKYDTSNFKVVPPFASLMKAVFNNTAIEKLQYDKDMISAYAILMGEIKLLEKGTTEKVDNFSIKPSTLGQLLELTKSSVQNNIKTLALPTTDNKYAQFTDGNPLMSQYQFRSSASQGAGASSLVYNDGKASMTETQNSITFDYETIATLYPQFETILGLYANKKTSKYKFKVHLKGCNYPHVRQEERKALNELFAVGIVPNVSYVASVYGMQPQTLDRMMTESKNGDMTDKLVMLLNKNTMSGVGGKEVGNQVKNDTELAEGGATSRDYT